MRCRHREAGGQRRACGAGRPPRACRLLPALYASVLASEAPLPRVLGPRPGEQPALAPEEARRSSGDVQQHRAHWDRLSSELRWLRNTVARLSPALLPHLVSHRGFHSTKDLSHRPIENSIDAYEWAWNAGVKLCECDVAVTLDGYLVLCHDEDLSRLSISAGDDSAVRVGHLTLQQLMGVVLRNGGRAPLLLDVLRSALKIGNGAQLVIEVPPPPPLPAPQSPGGLTAAQIKPGNAEAAEALMQMLIAEPTLLQAVAVVMSFDLFVVHKVARAMSAAGWRPEPGRESCSPPLEPPSAESLASEGGWVPTVHATTPQPSAKPAWVPNLLMLTVCKSPKAGEICLDVCEWVPPARAAGAGGAEARAPQPEDGGGGAADQAPRLVAGRRVPRTAARAAHCRGSAGDQGPAGARAGGRVELRGLGRLGRLGQAPGGRRLFVRQHRLSARLCAARRGGLAAGGAVVCGATWGPSSR